MQVIERTAGLEVAGVCRSIITAAVQRVPEPMVRRMIPLALRPTAQQQRNRFTVLTYNILADLYATQHAFPSSEAYTLLWQYRRQLILRELALYDADIVCLQEVQSTNFHEDLRPEMDRRGFDAVFKKKTQVRIPCDRSMILASEMVSARQCPDCDLCVGKRVKSIFFSATCRNMCSVKPYHPRRTTCCGYLEGVSYGKFLSVLRSRCRGFVEPPAPQPRGPGSSRRVLLRC